MSARAIFFLFACSWVSPSAAICQETSKNAEKTVKATATALAADALGIGHINLKMNKKIGEAMEIKRSKRISYAVFPNKTLDAKTITELSELMPSNGRAVFTYVDANDVTTNKRRVLEDLEQEAHWSGPERKALLQAEIERISKLTPDELLQEGIVVPIERKMDFASSDEVRRFFENIESKGGRIFKFDVYGADDAKKLFSIERSLKASRLARGVLYYSAAGVSLLGIGTALYHLHQGGSFDGDAASNDKFVKNVAVEQGAQGAENNRKKASNQR